MFDYVLPGFVLFCTRKILLLKKERLNESALYIVLSSAVIKTFVDFCVSMAHFSISGDALHFSYILTAVIVGIAEYILRRSVWFSDFTQKYLSISPSPNVWVRTIGTDGKTFVVVHTLSGHTLCGLPVYYGDDYIALAVYDIDEKDARKEGDLVTVYGACKEH